MTDTPHSIRRGELEIFQIDNAACSAEISLFGGQLLHWQPSGQKPVLWLSNDAKFDGSTALRGGIPICWPWFGPVENKGRHGLVRTKEWQLDKYAEHSDHAELTLSIDLDPSENPWPHPNRLEMNLRLGQELEQNLVVHNNGDTPLCFAYALHNYFCVSHPENILIPELKNSIFENKISNESQQIDPGTEQYCGPIDRVYLLDGKARLIDNKFNREIVIEKKTSQNWVLWNPGSDAQTIEDIHAGGENEFLCFEAANVSDVVVPAATSFEFGQKIWIE